MKLKVILVIAAMLVSSAALAQRVGGGGVPGAGGGGGATLPYPGIVYGTSATSGTVATSAQVSALVTGAINPSSTGAATPGTGGFTALSAATVDSSTYYADQYPGADIGAQINAAYAACPATGCTIKLPAGASSFSTAVSVGTWGKCALIEGAPGYGTVLTYAGSGTAITMNCFDNLLFPAGAGVRNLTLIGPGTGGSTIGLLLGGSNGSAGMNVENVSVSGFNQNITFGSNTWAVKLSHVFSRTATGGEALNFSGSLANAGEEISIDSSVFYSSTEYISNCFSLAPNGPYLNLVVTNTAFDNCQVVQSGGVVQMVNPHFENPAGTGAVPFLTSYYAQTSLTSPDFDDDNASTTPLLVEAKYDSSVMIAGATVRRTQVTGSIAAFLQIDPGGSASNISPLVMQGVGTVVANSGTVIGPTSAPNWLQWRGTGQEGALNVTSGTTVLFAEHWYSSINISSGATVVDTATPVLILRSTGTCTIAGTISMSVNTASGLGGGTTAGNIGGSGGGGSGGTAAGAAGSTLYTGVDSAIGGTAGGVTGGNAGSGNQLPEQGLQYWLSNGPPNPMTTTTTYNDWGGTAGGAGGSSGGAAGNSGGFLVLDCQSINFTGTIDASGGNGGASTGNNKGAGGGGGGGAVILSAASYVANTGTINVTGGTGGSCGTYTGCGTAGSGGSGNSVSFTTQ